MQTDYDVAIVGAGLVGLVLTSLLVENGLRVAIIEAGSFDAVSLKKNEYQLRVSAINLACKELFSDLNIWEEIYLSGRLSAFEKMFVWDSLGRGEIEFDCTEIAEPCLGYIIENAVLHNALYNKLKKNPEVTFFANRKPIALALSARQIEITLNHHDEGQLAREVIKAELLVGADGANSWVREQANIQSYSWPYDHQALVTTVKVESSHQKTAWQCFLQSGPLALLPLYDESICSIVWSAPPNEISRLSKLNERDFNLEISNSFEYRLGKIEKISSQVCIPLVMRHAKNYINTRIALVGDAAHTIHPLAGQGVNMGFADACALARNIFESKQSLNDCGNYLQLKKYERERKSDNWIMIFGMEFFKRLFQKKSKTVAQLRSLGLNGVNKFQLIKNQFIYKAVGR